VSFLTTVNNRTGARRYFINGRRVSRAAQDRAQFWMRLDSFLTMTRGDVTRHWCSGSPNR